MTAEKNRMAGEQIRNLRQKKGLTYRRLAELAGIQFGSLASIEAGRRPVGLLTALRIADGLGLVDPERERFLEPFQERARPGAIFPMAKVAMEVTKVIEHALRKRGIPPGTRLHYDGARTVADSGAAELFFYHGTERLVVEVKVQ